MTTKKRLIPTGECWCGCGEETARGAFFRSSHDRKAESAVIKLVYGGIAEFLHENGFGPGGRKAVPEYERTLKRER